MGMHVRRLEMRGRARDRLMTAAEPDGLPDSVAQAEEGVPLDPLSRMVPRAVFSGGNEVRLLRGGDELFPAMLRAIATARHEIWLATYIFNDDEAALTIATALCDAARRGVQVKVVIDGFGSRATIAPQTQLLCGAGVGLAVFRP